MGEVCLTASEFRIYMKDYGNRISHDQERVVVTRHGRRMFAVVSEEDLEFLQKHRPNPKRAPVPDPVPESPSFVPRCLDHPDTMEVAEVQRIYAATNGTTERRLCDWRSIAFLSLMAAGAQPDTPP